MKPVQHFIYGAFIGLACNNSLSNDEQKSLTASDSITNPQYAVINNTTKDSVPQNIQIDSVIHFAFAKDSFSVAVKGHLDKRGDPVICYLPVTTGKKLKAVVVAANSKANIRFSHIYLPDGKSDGPFGNSLNFNLTQKGIYKIYIGPNMMAGDPVGSDFVVRVKVE